jgi:hypothetical protein
MWEWLPQKKHINISTDENRKENSSPRKREEIILRKP